MPAISDTLTIGQQVGPYRIEALLGGGGMGYVYRATGQTGESVALKLVKADLARDSTFRRRFAREARIAQEVAHPHLVPVLATGEYEGVPYMAQKFVGNGTLADRIAQEGGLEVSTTLRICQEVAGGLDALHARELVHRDVKPGNILLNREGTAFVTDFGLAKDVRGTVLTRPGQALGSIDYMAPEQIRGETITPAADVYALGCSTWECLCGVPPFADRQGMRVLWAHLQDEPANPRANRPDLPDELGEAILLALRKDPAQRPRSATLFVRMLEIGAGLADA